MDMLNDISEALQKGKSKVVKELVQKALDEGVGAVEILNGALITGMDIIGVKFRNNEVYVPEVLIAARAMNSGMELLKPHLVSSGQKSLGKAVIGTVKGDLHDIGKNLVKMMIEGKGIDVVDLGTDVSAESFYDAFVKENAQIICCSALLTTTMGEMKKVVEVFEKNGVREKATIMIGGAPITEDFCKSIGADYYTSDAASAAEVAKNVLTTKYA